MTDNHESTLLDVFTEVLEQLAFMFAEAPDTSSPQLDSASIVKAAMEFKGPFTGNLDLIVPRAMCEELAANVLGLEPTDDIVQRAPFDALKELLNVTCGNVLTALAGDEPVFDLSIPTVEELDSAQWGDLQNRPETVFCLVDGFPVLLHLEVSA